MVLESLVYASLNYLNKNNDCKIIDDNKKKYTYKILKNNKLSKFKKK